MTPLDQVAAASDVAAKLVSWPWPVTPTPHGSMVSQDRFEAR
jgi:hypothetical protein